ncbi:hypothetical protein [Vagococcus luciliae]|uniref:Uncharacterized protein n=1 Tax=Vagococcus luciliae TaxID=2920380 RepID=A0ABY5NYZ5_9ENTE|nr:hypothetical protein [Vagococcus luciliae]UUV98880.1 hypothetical protein G314FT_10380 [Vagococcus luciliae]
MNNLIDHYKQNSLVILFFLATTLTCLNISSILFILSLILTVLTITIPIWFSKKDVSLYDEIASIVNKLLLKMKSYNESYKQKRANDFKQQLRDIETAQKNNTMPY